MQARAIAAYEAPPVELDSAEEVLAHAREQRAISLTAEAEILRCAVTWAEQHPPESIHESATWMVSGTLGGVDTGIPIAGPGAPLVAEFCLAEFAVNLGLSTDAGRRLVGDSVELKYRLCRLWDRVMGGSLPTWRARRIAEATRSLSLEAAVFVDAQVAAFAHKLGVVALDRLVAEATARFMPAQAGSTP